MGYKNVLQKKIAGFTYVELLVAITIIGIILSVSLFNHRQFLARIRLSNAAYELASILREAQTYGVSVQQYNASDPNFTIPRGVRFTRNDPLYYSFSDVDKDGEFSFAERDVTHTLGSFTVDRICVESGCTSVSALTISFTRPDPNARIQKSGVIYSQGRITIKDIATGATRDIVVYSTGHIDVE